MAKKPKRPKIGASIKTWENYEKKLKKWEADKKKKEQIRNRTS